MSITNGGSIPIFQYKEEDFNFVVNKNDDVKSVFDSFVIQRWEEAQKNGIFKYTLNIEKQKVLEGKYGLLVQLNPDRGEKRRKPEHITSMSQPFDPNLFNFTKILNQEILFDVGTGDGNDVVAANISPIESYHSLLITERFKCLPQRVTQFSLKRAIDLLLLSNSPYLRVIFNSLCAHASINHLHWHLYYLKHEMLLESIKIDHLRGPIFILRDFPAKGFCLKLSSFPNRNINCLLSWTYFLIEYLQTSSVAHNVYITRGKENFDSDIYDDVRTYIWARQSTSGVKNTCDFIPAVCELFGHISIKNAEGYQGLTEDGVAKILNDITSDSFDAVKRDLLKIDLNIKEYYPTSVE